MYMAPACMLWLLLGVALVEWPRIAAENALGLMVAKPGLYLCAAAMGFGVNSLAYIVIQLASSLTLKVGAAMQCALLSDQVVTESYNTPSCVGLSEPLLAPRWHVMASTA